MLERAREESRCLACHEINRSHVPYETGGRGPRKGDLSLCTQCGTIGFFDERLDLVPATEEQLADLVTKQPKIFDQIMAARAFVEARINSGNKKSPTVPFKGRCEVCHYSFSEVVKVMSEHKKLKPYDFTMCPNCGTICMVDKEMNLRQLTHREMELIQERNPKLYATMEHYSKKIQEDRRNN